MAEIDPVTGKLLDYINERATAQDKMDKWVYGLMFVLMIINASLGGANLWFNYNKGALEVNTNTAHSVQSPAAAPTGTVVHADEEPNEDVVTVDPEGPAVQ